MTQEQLQELLEENDDLALDGVPEEELLGAFRLMPSRMRNRHRNRVNKVVQRRRKRRNSRSGSVSVISNGSAVTMSRNEFEARFGQLSKELQRDLAQKRKQLVDTEFYVVKSISGDKTKRVLQDDDNKIPGVCNISGGKIEKGEVFLLSALQLLSAVGSGTDETQDAVGVLDFGLIETALRNGEFEFKGNGKTLIPPHSMQAFANQFLVKHSVDSSGAYDQSTAVVGMGITSIGENTRPGLLKLANPKMIQSQVSMEFNAYWASAATTNAYVKLGMIGTRIINY